MFCMKCGEAIPDGSIICSKCGGNQTEAKTQQAVVYASQKEILIENVNYQSKRNRLKSFIKKNSKKAMLISIIIAVISLIVLIVTISKTDYAFYLENYNDCVRGYKETSSYRGMFASNYKYIANGYKDLINTWLLKIWGYRIKVTGSLILLIISSIFAFKCNKYNKKVKN